MSDKPATKKYTTKAIERLAVVIKQDVKDTVAEAIEEFAVIVKRTFDHYDDRMDRRFAEQDHYIDKRFAEQDKRIDKRFAEQDKRIDKRFAEQEAKLIAYIDHKAEETMRHFDVVAENIHHDIAGANKDEIVFIKNKQHDHEIRLTEVERRVALR